MGKETKEYYKAYIKKSMNEKASLKLKELKEEDKN